MNRFAKILFVLAVVFSILACGSSAPTAAPAAAPTNPPAPTAVPPTQAPTDTAVPAPTEAPIVPTATEAVPELVVFESPDGLLSVEVPGAWLYEIDDSTENVMAYTFYPESREAVVQYLTYDDGKTRWNQGEAGKLALSVLNNSYTNGSGDIKITDDKIDNGIEYLTWNSREGQYTGVTVFRAKGTLVALITFLCADSAKEQYGDQLDYLISTLTFK